MAFIADIPWLRWLLFPTRKANTAAKTLIVRLLDGYGNLVMGALLLLRSSVPLI